MGRTFSNWKGYEVRAGKRKGREKGFKERIGKCRNRSFVNEEQKKGWKVGRGQN